MKVDAEVFEEALGQLVLDVPLTLRAPQQGWLVRASHSGNAADSRWQRLMRKSFGGICEPGQRRDHCLSLLDDGMGLGEWDKLGIALGLSVLLLDSTGNHRFEELDGATVVEHAVL